MKPEGNQEIYRVAFEAANSELNEISVHFERLRIRKELVERLVSVLRPLFEEEEQPAVSASAQVLAAERSETAAGAVKETSEEPSAFTADPFQRRIDHVLGIGAGIRDVRKYTRQF